METIYAILENFIRSTIIMGQISKMECMDSVTFDLLYIIYLLYLKYAHSCCVIHKPAPHVGNLEKTLLTLTYR